MCAISRPARGFATAIVLLVLLILFVMGSAIVVLGTSSLNLASTALNQEKAYYAAESGLAAVMAKYGQTASWPATSEVALEGDPDTSYSVEVYDNSGGGVPMQVPNGPLIPAQTVYLRSTGRAGPGIRRQAAALIKQTAGSLTVGALASEFDIHDEAEVDAFDSSVGPYSATSLVSGTNLLATNEETNLSGGYARIHPDNPGNGHHVNIKGKVYVGPGGDPSTMVHALMDTQGTANLPDPIPVPSVDIPDLPDKFLTPSYYPVGSGTHITLPPGEYGFVDIWGAGTEVQLEPNGRYVFDKLNIGGGAKLVLGADAENVEVYVRTDCEITAKDTIVNETEKARNLKIFYDGHSDSDPMWLAGGGKAYYVAISPDAPIELGGGHLYGALRTNKKLWIGKVGGICGAFHYDVSLATDGAGGSVSLQVLSRYRL